MPTYEFEIRDDQGQVVGQATCILPVDQRDKVQLHRRTAPRSINIGAAANPMNQASEVMQGYHRLEQKHGSGINRMLGEFTPAQIKQAWSEP